MISQKNLSSRVRLARTLVPFASIVNDRKKSMEVFIPGSNAKRYRVILKWIRVNGKMTLASECGVETSCGYIDCLGNTHSLCYHTIAAVIAVANAHKTKISFSATEENAKKAANFHKGKINPLVSKQSGYGRNGNSIWIVS